MGSDRAAETRRTATESPPFGAAFGLWLAARGVSGMVSRAAAVAGWSANEFAVASLVDALDRVTLTELAHWYAAPLTTISSLVRRMTDREELAQEPDPDDGRRVVVSLTGHGRNLHRRVCEAFAPASAELDRRLAQLGVDGALLAAVRDRIDSAADTGDQ